ncbi:hypothetical protein [Streptomyces fulvorobeus]|uniref:Uncharacterized protein n=1 Tax=Streptomyces fulvorobeus TaxID=284028 RepID=A0A7J0C7F5_9ACTN|nr:hypothetical protein [Streptomyces fulvorobeus]NYE41955.1 hypothetical protein [Streptomyces fulvorobeus]GFM98328.1 hypothetical protein Sfulv_31390 [Streptomyces fulvorobeus]
MWLDRPPGHRDRCSGGRAVPGRRGDRLRRRCGTAYRVEWWRRFGPASGNEPRLEDPFGRYVITTFVHPVLLT